ncbi:MAG: 23S rRNA accumulation protein YceD [Vibrionaceae bacterium]
MQKVKLPLTVDPIKSAQKRLDYNGLFVKERLERLSEFTAKPVSDAQVTLSFGVDAQGLKVIHGQAKVDLLLECQRCWESFSHSCEATFVYSPVFNDEQADNLPQAYEPVYVDENGEINLLQLVEDEFILALPQVALHDLADCKIGTDEHVFGEIPLEEERPNPFAVLKNLEQNNKE